VDLTHGYLNLRSKALGPAGAARLAGVLARDDVRRAVTSVSLGDNGLGSEGVESLAPALSRLPNLTSLALWMNRIGPNGGKKLGESLQQSRLDKLVSLDLSNNEIGLEGGKALGQGIGSLRSLKVLHLEGCKIGEDGVKAIFQGARNLPQLEEIYFWGNNVSDPVRAELRAQAPDSLELIF